MIGYFDDALIINSAQHPDIRDNSLKPDLIPYFRSLINIEDFLS